MNYFRFEALRFSRSAFLRNFSEWYSASIFGVSFFSACFIVSLAMRPPWGGV